MLATMQNFADSPPQAKLGCALMAVGAAKATEHLVGLVRGAWKHFLRPRRWLLSRYACPDVEPWVVISGKLGLTTSIFVVKSCLTALFCVYLRRSHAGQWMTLTRFEEGHFCQ